MQELQEYNYYYYGSLYSFQLNRLEAILKLNEKLKKIKEVKRVILFNNIINQSNKIKERYV